jgi:hypothetical protein
MLCGVTNVASIRGVIALSFRPQGDDDERQLWGARNCILAVPVEEANAGPADRRISKAIVEFYGLGDRVDAGGELGGIVGAAGAREGT